MKISDDKNVSFKSRLLDVVRGKIELIPSLQTSFIRHCNIAEMTLEEKYLLYFSIINQSANSVVITDDNKRIIYVNKKFEQVSGYQSCEVLGKDPKILGSNKTPREVYRDMFCTLKSKAMWKGRFVNARPDGIEYIEDVTITPITNIKGDIICYLGEKQDITAQIEAEQAVQQLTCFDNLTGVHSRSYFVERARCMADERARDDNGFAILFVDLNRFKKINDIYGHPVGDKALKIVAQRLSKIVYPGDFVARVGGDEFVVVHCGLSKRSTEYLAKKIVNSFDTPLMIDGKEHFLSASIGSAIWPTDGTTLTQLLSRADLAMYNGKNLGLCYSPYTSNIGDKYIREFELSRKLNLAITEHQLSLVYQPKICLRTGQIDGMEALLRWNDPELGMVSPAEFIPIAEKYKMMSDIGNWLIKAVCVQLNIWKRNRKSFKGRIAINISVQQIETSNFYDNIIAIFESENISPNQIEFEVTESLLISDPDKIIELFARLKAVGFSIAIDDFGTGYSSLSYLNKLRVNSLKIDRSFIKEITVDTHEQAIVKSIVELGHNLGVSVVAEGVETKEQLNYLLSLGCDVAQGYFFHMPVPGNQVFPLCDFANLYPEPDKMLA